ncbi:hypothetical protein PV797_14455 [Clostridiaceae bacterium M8S5]|nr:hypothetical protein PV797_14455 [Clostridiaceae bacterium M8S5]
MYYKIALAIILLIILVSIQYTLNKILLEIKKLGRILEKKTYK